MSMATMYCDFGFDLNPDMTVRNTGDLIKALHKMLSEDQVEFDIEALHVDLVDMDSAMTPQILELLFKNSITECFITSIYKEDKPVNLI